MIGIVRRSFTRSNYKCPKVSYFSSYRETYNAVRTEFASKNFRDQVPCTDISVEAEVYSRDLLGTHKFVTDLKTISEHVRQSLSDKRDGQSLWNCVVCNLPNKMTEELEKGGVKHIYTCRLCNEGREADRIKVLQDVVYSDSWVCTYCNAECSRLMKSCSRCNTLKGEIKPPIDIKAINEKKNLATILESIRPKSSKIDAEVESDPEWDRTDSESELEFLKPRDDTESESELEKDDPLKDPLHFSSGPGKTVDFNAVAMHLQNTPGLLDSSEKPQGVNRLGFEKEIFDSEYPCYYCGKYDHSILNCPDILEYIDKHNPSEPLNATKLPALEKQEPVFEDELQFNEEASSSYEEETDASEGDTQSFIDEDMMLVENKDTNDVKGSNNDTLVEEQELSDFSEFDSDGDFSGDLDAYISGIGSDLDISGIDSDGDISGIDSDGDISGIDSDGDINKSGSDGDINKSGSDGDILFTSATNQTSGTEKVTEKQQKSYLNDLEEDLLKEVEEDALQNYYARKQKQRDAIAHDTSLDDLDEARNKELCANHYSDYISDGSDSEDTDTLLGISKDEPELSDGFKASESSESESESSDSSDESLPKLEPHSEEFEDLMNSFPSKDANPKK